MARRSDHTREELKNLVIQVGYNLLKTDGPTDFSARKIARSIGYTIGTLYNVFGTHEVLMLHIQGRILDDWYHTLQQAVQTNKDKPPLHVLAWSYIDYAKKNYGTWSILFSRNAVSKDQAPDWYKEKLDRFFGLVECILLPIVNNDKQEASRSARIIWASIHGICLLTLTNKLDLLAEETSEKMAYTMIDTYMKGLGKHG